MVRAQGPVLIKEVISREHALFTGADPDDKETVSREVALFVGADPDAREVVSREVSLLLSDAALPPAVTGLVLTVSPTRDAVTVDWSAYNQWAVRDVAQYAVYFSTTYFTSTAGLTPRLVPGENFTSTFTGLPVGADFYFAVVAVDGLGNALTTVTPKSNYALTQEVISRETALFNGYEGTPQYHELVSREVSLLLSDATPPPPVTNLSFISSPTGKNITLNWDGYNQWATRDVSYYEIYRSTAPFTSVAGLTPYATVRGESFSINFPDLPENVDSFWAVVAVDGQEHRQTSVSYKGVYVISPQAISREVALFNGSEPATPQMKEIVSREVSLAVASPAIPDPVTGLATGFEVTTATTQYAAIEADWTSYNEAAQRDVRRYRVYVANAFFDTVAGLTPFKIVADGTQRQVLTGTGENGFVISPEQIYFVAAVAEDVAGNFNPVVYSESVKASVGALGDVANVVATPAPSTVQLTWDLGGVGTNLQDFVREFRVYISGDHLPDHLQPQNQPVRIDPAVRNWTATSLAFGTTYTIRFTTVDVLGEESTGVTVVATTPTVPPGEVELAWNPGANGTVWTTVMQSGDQLILAGSFTEIGGVAKSRIARMNLDGVVDPSFTANADDVVYTVIMQPDGKILLGGLFTSIAGQTRNRVARLNADGTLDAGFNPNASATVRGMALQPDGMLIVGGDFTEIGGIPRNRLARVYADGTVDPSFDPDANDIVRPVLLQPDGKILVGGTFSSIAGAARYRLVRLNANGTLDASFTADFDKSVQSLQLAPDGRILVGGTFTTVSGTERTGLARLSSNGVLDPTFLPETNSGNVWSLTGQTDGRILVGGSFTTLGGISRNGVARILEDGTLDPVFNPDARTTTVVSSLMLQPDGKIVMGGNFTSAGAQMRNRLARLYNNPAPGVLSIGDISQLTWRRGGASAEASQTLFDVTTDNGLTWLPLGNGTRVAGGWERSGLALPPAGLLRGRARSASGTYGTSSGFMETLLPYNVYASAEAWRQFYFTAAANIGSAADGADPDRDGMVNLLERAFGSNPLDPASHAVPEWRWTSAYAASSFLAPDGVNAGLRYDAQWSTDLETWHTVPVTESGNIHSAAVPRDGLLVLFVRWRVRLE